MNPETVRRLDGQRQRQVRKAERDSGFKEGERIWRGRPANVTVTFYQGVKWWIEADGERMLLTKKIWEQTIATKAARKETDNG